MRRERRRHERRHHHGRGAVPPSGTATTWASGRHSTRSGPSIRVVSSPSATSSPTSCAACASEPTPTNTETRRPSSPTPSATRSPRSTSPSAIDLPFDVAHARAEPAVGAVRGGAGSAQLQIGRPRRRRHPTHVGRRSERGRDRRVRRRRACSSTGSASVSSTNCRPRTTGAACSDASSPGPRSGSSGSATSTRPWRRASKPSTSACSLPADRRPQAQPHRTSTSCTRPPNCTRCSPSAMRSIRRGARDSATARLDGSRRVRRDEAALASS